LFFARGPELAQVEHVPDGTASEEQPTAPARPAVVDSVNAVADSVNDVLRRRVFAHATHAGRRPAGVEPPGDFELAEPAGPYIASKPLTFNVRCSVFAAVEISEMRSVRRMIVDGIGSHGVRALRDHGFDGIGVVEIRVRLLVVSQA